MTSGNKVDLSEYMSFTPNSVYLWCLRASLRLNVIYKKEIKSPITHHNWKDQILKCVRSALYIEKPTQVWLITNTTSKQLEEYNSC